MGDWLGVNGPPSRPQPVMKT